MKSSGVFSCHLRVSHEFTHELVSLLPCVALLNKFVPFGLNAYHHRLHRYNSLGGKRTHLDPLFHPIFKFSNTLLSVLICAFRG
jgi:hypothetical protein